MIGDFIVDTIDLSSRNDVTGLKNTANVYWVEGIDRPLPLAQLVMAICFERAAAKEQEVVKLMNTLANTTKMIEELAWFENKLVEFADTGISAKTVSGKDDVAWAIDWITIVKDRSEIPAGWGPWANKGRWTQWLYELGALTKDDYEKTFWKQNMTPDDVSKVLDLIETKLDSLNTTSQKDMIKLQSETTKRDQTYDLITAMVKSISGVNSSISSSMR